MEKPLHIFCCYARTDQSYLLELNKRLVPLQREGLIVVHTDINISPGEEWEQKIHDYLNTAHIILLLITPDFVASDYCYSKEMQIALERHTEGKAYVIPIILRSVDLRYLPFGKIQSLPTNAQPVANWPNQDNAFLDVANGIQETIEKLLRPTLSTMLQPRSTLKQSEQQIPAGSQVIYHAEDSAISYSGTAINNHFQGDQRSAQSPQTGKKKG